jgi:hypothetical protein
VKLRGRTEAPALGAEGAQFLSARGAKPEAFHGPLQRLLDGMSLALSGPCFALPRRGDRISPSSPPAGQIGNVANRRISLIHAAEANDTTVRWLVRGTAQDLPRPVVLIVGYQQYG